MGTHLGSPLLLSYIAFLWGEGVLPLLLLWDMGGEDGDMDSTYSHWGGSVGTCHQLWAATHSHISSSHSIFHKEITISILPMIQITWNFVGRFDIFVCMCFKFYSIYSCLKTNCISQTMWISSQLCKTLHSLPQTSTD